MIVKDEAKVIGRALDGARPFVDYVLVSDTGSTDGTQGIIRSWLRDTGTPGELIERPWIDFAHNRNEAIDALRRQPQVDYALSIDADEYLVCEPGFDLPAFRNAVSSADGWWIATRDDHSEFRRLQLFSLRKRFAYRYKVHEILAPPEGASIKIARGFHNAYTRDGARARNPATYANDVRVIEAAMVGETDPAALRHYTFFLAQSQASAGNFEQARDGYLRRAAMGGGTDGLSRCYSYAAGCMERLGASPEEIITMYLRAHELAPSRAEPICSAARIANGTRLHQQAYELTKPALDMTPPDVSMIDHSAYTWRMLDEFQVACCGLRRFDEAVEASERLLSEARFPESERQRIEANATYALAAYDFANVNGAGGLAINPTA